MSEAGTGIEGRGVVPLLAVALGLAIGCALFVWPGIAAYDTVRQYEQALQGHYDDWHPPVMAWLWAGLLSAGLRGTGPLLLLQLGLYWSGIALIAAGLARSGARGAAWVALLAGLSPLAVDWIVVVVKDAQMLGAMVAATGIVAFHRLGGRAMRWPALAGVALLIGYATLVRANSVFATVPLLLVMAEWGGVRRWLLRLGLMLALVLLAILGSGLVNHRLIGAERSHVERTLPLFDLVGIAHRAKLATVPGITPAQWAEAERQGCYTPFYWDPFGDEARCGAMGDAIVDPDDGPGVGHNWIAAIVAHPLAYAGHRLGHLNATLRLATPADERSAAAPLGSQPNPYGLGAPAGPALRGLEAFAAAIARTPLGAPGWWLVVMAALGWTLHGTARQPARDLGLALALSAALMTASFAVVSIASDLRYHLWLIVATGLAGAMLAGCEGIAWRRLRIGAAVVAVAFVASVVLRSAGIAMRY